MCVSFVRDRERARPSSTAIAAPFGGLVLIFVFFLDRKLGGMGDFGVLMLTLGHVGEHGVCCVAEDN
jgi:hypothetical protein